jgi:uncharacterized protein YuzE
VKKLELCISVETNNETGHVAAVYFQIRKGKAAQTRELVDGNAFVDYSASGQLLGIELLAPCNVTVLDRIARQEPKVVKTFLRSTIPQEMALARD